ncbi:MAG TPA: chloride channel protein [Terriglobales bacterium]|jgi:H+/Cl- antiporter ClcA|nr:chloride channel protein [Terriglobales bacterium]
MTQSQDHNKASHHQPRNKRPSDDASGLSVAGLVEGPIPTAVKFRMLLVSFLAAAIGAGAGVIAWVLYNLIGLFTNLSFYHQLSFRFRSPEANTLGLWVIVIPVVGGIVVGVMAKYGSSKIRGHGIPEAMEAVLVNRSKIEPKVAILKPISAAIAIGTGGPFGAEGPIIQTGGSVGSLVGQLFHMTAAERKVLLACGAGAGMAATFNTPIAAVVLAIELLLFEFKSRSFIPLVIAATIATSVHIELMGPGQMFKVSAVDFGLPAALPWYVVLGVLCGLAAVGFSKLLYWVEDQFERLPLDDMWWPAIGALGLGIIGYFVPRVLGVGYDTITAILNNQLLLKTLLLVLLFKALALVISLGSGTSGGLLAPMFMSSAAMGGAFALGLNYGLGTHLAPGAFALVAMGAVFGAASRATFTFIIFAFEITRDYNSVLPLMLVCVIADGISMFFTQTSIMTEKLARRGLHIHQDYEPDVLQSVPVSETMSTDISTIPETLTVAELARRLASNDPHLRHYAWPVVDADAKLKGIITRGDVLRALEQDPAGAMTVLEAGSKTLIVTYPDELLYTAAEKMLHNRVGRLLVVSRTDPTQMVGYLGRSGIMAARLKRLEEEHVREPGWIKRFAKR